MPRKRHRAGPQGRQSGKGLSLSSVAAYVGSGWRQTASPEDPPAIVETPWNTAVVEWAITPGTLTPFNGTSIASQLRTQLGIPSGGTIAMRIQHVALWGSGRWSSTADSSPASLVLYSLTTGVEVGSYHDRPTAANRAHVAADCCLSAISSLSVGLLFQADGALLRTRLLWKYHAVPTPALAAVGETDV